jgi:hypothetical protein
VLTLGVLGALLHLVSSRHAEILIVVWRQIAKASSSDATTSVGSPAPRPPARRAPGGRSAPRRARRSRPWRCGPACARASVAASTSGGMVRLDPVVSRLLGSVPGRWEQLPQHHRRGRCPVSTDRSRRQLRRGDGPRKAPVHRRRIPPWGPIHVDDLAALVDRPRDVPPAAADRHRRLVHRPAISNTMTAGSGRAASASGGVKPSTHREPVRWSTSTLRSASRSSTSRKDSPTRSYQRTASTITSAGRRKPAKADRVAGPGRGRRALISAVSLLGRSRR